MAGMRVRFGRARLGATSMSLTAPGSVGRAGVEEAEVLLEEALFLLTASDYLELVLGLAEAVDGFEDPSGLREPCQLVNIRLLDALRLAPPHGLRPLAEANQPV
jgi:hypothetical protein